MTRTHLQVPGLYNRTISKNLPISRRPSQLLPVLIVICHGSGVLSTRYIDPYTQANGHFVNRFDSNEHYTMPNGPLYIISSSRSSVPGGHYTECTHCNIVWWNRRANQYCPPSATSRRPARSQRQTKLWHSANLAHIIQWLPLSDERDLTLTGCNEQGTRQPTQPNTDSWGCGSIFFRDGYAKSSRG